MQKIFKRFFSLFLSFLMLLTQVTPTLAQAQEDNQEEFVITEDGELTQWNRPDDFDGNLVIPESVESIGENVFSNQEIASLQLNQGLKEIKQGAFSDNYITEISLPDSLEVIGKDAFRNNELTQVIFPESLLSIGPSSFQDNNIENIDLKAITEIGDEAFRSNNLVTVDIPESVTSFGTNVFLDNNRYVKVITQNELITSEVTQENYGHILNPVAVRIHFVDKESKEEIIDPKVLGEDLSALGQVFEQGQESTYIPEQITGYLPEQKEVTFTPELKEGDYFDLQVTYIKADKKPILEITPVINLEQNEKVDKEKLLSFVTKAEDALGNDIKDKVTVSPETIDTKVPGESSVTYSLTDENGNTTNLQAKIYVAMDWRKTEVGGGYLVEDFIFGDENGNQDNENGNTILGFSETGKAKSKDHPTLFLPTINYAGKEVSILGEGAFKGNLDIKSVTGRSIVEIKANAFNPSADDNIANGNITSLSFPLLKKLNGDNIFKGNSIEEISMPALEEISGSDIFYSTKLKELSLPSLKTISGNNVLSFTTLEELSLPKLETIKGDTALGASNAIKEISLPSLKTLDGNTTFSYFSELEKLDLPKLEIVSGDSNFEFVYVQVGLNSPVIRKPEIIKEISFPALKEISGDNNFYSNESLVKLSFPVLEKISGNTNFNSMQAIKEISFPALEIISGDGNFKYLHTAYIINEELEILFPALKEISGNNNFDYYDYYTKSFPALEIISGDENFGIQSTRELSFPSLREISGYMNFSEYIYDSNANYEAIKIYGDPSVGTIHRENWVLNPSEGSTDEKDLTDDDILWKNNDPATATMIGFKDKGYQKIKNSGGKIVLPESVEAIEGVVFYEISEITSIEGDNVKKLSGNRIISSLKNLKEISLPKLESINGDYNFYELDNLEYLNLPSLTSIEGIYNINELDELKKLSLPSLTTIKGKGTNYEYNISFLNKLRDLSLPKLQTIDGSSNLNNLNWGNGLDFISLPALKIIKGNSNLYSIGDTQSISLGNLETIDGDHNIKNIEIQSIALPRLKQINGSYNLNSLSDTKDISLPELTSIIGDRNFYNNLELKKLYTPKLTNISIKEGLPNNYNNRDLKLIWTISDDFEGSEEDLKKFVSYLLKDREGNPVIIYTENRTNKNKIQSVEDVFLFNPLEVTFEYVDQDGEEIYPERLEYVDRSKSYSPKYPLISGYKTPEVKPIDPSKISDPSYTEKVVYTKYTEEELKEFQNRTQRIGLKHVLGNSTGIVTTLPGNMVGSEFITRVCFDLSGYDADLSGYTIKVEFDESVVDKNKIKFQKNSEVIEDQWIDGNVIYLKLGNVKGGTSLDYPITWAFKQKVTPANTNYPFTASLFDKEDNLFAYTEPIYNYGFYKDPQFQKTHNNGVDGYIYTENLHKYGEGSFDYEVTEDEELVYNFNLSYLQRNIGEYTLTDTIPYYTDKDGKSLLAKADPEENPGWEISEDGKIATYKGNAYNSTDIKKPKLILRVPGAKIHSTIRNDAKIELVPYNKGKNEDNIVQESHVSHHYSLKGGNGSIFEKDILMPHISPDREAYFYDIQSERDLEYTWLIGYQMPQDPENPLTKVYFGDYGLDERMYYTGIRVPQEMDKASVSLYKGDKVVKRDVLEGNKKYVIPESLQREITEIRIEKTEGADKIGSGEVQIYTRLREPNREQYDDTAQSEKNAYVNHARGKLTFKEGEPVVKKDIKDYLNLRAYQQKIGVEKTTDLATGNLYPGEKGSYTLSVKKVSDLLGDKFTDFEMIDLLPNGLDIESIELLGKFKDEPTHSYEIVENYNGSGQTAVVFKAKELDLTDMGETSKIAKINVALNETIDNGSFTNDVFLRVGNTSISLNNPTTDDRLGGGEYSKSSVTRVAVKSKELIARKYISKDGNYWSKTGIMTESKENFKYKLSVMNETDKDRKDMSFIDILPYANDTAIIENDEGERVSRESEFANTFDYKTGITIPEGYDIYYLNEKVPSLEGKSLDEEEVKWNWETQGSSNTTAIKIVAKEGTVLKANSRLDIIIPMIAPDNTDGSLNGKRAYNTYVRKDDTTNRFIEPNRVYNELPSPKGTITLTKVSGDEKLQGAIFGIWDSDGNFIDQKESDQEGFISFVDLDLTKDYVVKEMKAPEGYALDSKEIQVKGSDILEEENHVKDLGQITNNKKWVPIEPVKASLSFNKLGKDNKPIEGVSFRLKGKDPWNQYINITAISDKDGKVVFDGIEHGKYSLTELETTNLKPIAEKEVSVKAGYNLVENTIDDVVNDKGRLTVVKLGILEDKKDTPITQMQRAFGTELKDVELALYKGDLEVEKQTTDINGEVVFDNLELDTVYTIKESKKHPDYSLIYDKVNFKITREGKLVTEDGEEFLTNKLYLPNLKDKKESLVTITKKANTGELLEGVEFGLYKKIDDDFVLQEKKKTGEDGVVSFDKLTGGIYQVKEEKGLPNYFLTNKVEEFTVDDYKQKTFEYEYENKKLDLNARKISYVKKFITKEEADQIVAKNPDEKLLIEQDNDLYNVYKNVDGAKFDLREKGSDQTLGVFTSQDGKIDFKDFEFDTSKNYDLVEVEAPEGYILDKTTKPLNLKDYAKLKDFDGKVDLVIENKPVVGKVIVSKFKNLNKQPLEGTLFEIRTKDGALVDQARTDKTGDVIFDNLALGDYVIREKEASEGYMKNDTEVKVSLTEEEPIAFVSYYNKIAISKELPVTGLTSALAVIGGLIVSIALGGYFLRKKRLY